MLVLQVLKMCSSFLIEPTNDWMNNNSIKIDVGNRILSQGHITYFEIVPLHDWVNG